MALRLIEIVLREKDGTEACDLLGEYKVLECKKIQLMGGEVMIRILLDSAQSEQILDILEKRYIGRENNRIVILPVEATLPRAGLEQEARVKEEPLSEEKITDRIGREELYEDIKNAAKCSRIYLALIVLSTILATIGLLRNNITIIIGAMVIAPLLGPSMALVLGTTLGDLPLLWRALRTSLAGIATTMVLATVIGAMVYVDPTLPEVVLRTHVEWSDIVLALASGCAGALAFTMGGVAEALIGVMVAVALLPPLVTCGLLLGGGQISLALGSFILFLVNLICINLAGVITFVIQGVHPVTWWEKDLAAKATRISIGIWLTFLMLLAVLILFLRG